MAVNNLFANDEISNIHSSIQLKKEETIVHNWKSLNNKPKCIVFDLDYTVWPFIIDSQLLPPFRRENNQPNGHIFDHNKRKVTLYEDIELIVKTLKEKCFKIDDDCARFLAIASRSTVHNQAVELLEMFGLFHYFDSIQIYSGSKQKHIKTIRNDLKLEKFSDILFFDDNKSNLEQTQALGLVGHQVRRHYGLSLNDFYLGLKKFNNFRAGN